MCFYKVIEGVFIGYWQVFLQCIGRCFYRVLADVFSG